LHCLTEEFLGYILLLTLLVCRFQIVVVTELSVVVFDRGQTTAAFTFAGTPYLREVMPTFANVFASDGNN